MPTEATRAALLALETDPTMDPEERAVHAATIRDELEELERRSPPAPRTPAAAPPASPRARECVVWSRGTSFSVRAQETDVGWLQALYERAFAGTAARPEIHRVRLLVRPVRPEPFDWTRGTRAHVLLIEEESNEPRPGDWIVEGALARNFGGQSGQNPGIATFGFRALHEVKAETRDTSVPSIPAAMKCAACGASENIVALVDEVPFCGAHVEAAANRGGSVRILGPGDDREVMG
ncbi:MAG TPA: hypothetical protein VE261_00600 [Gaiellaceae bacterium]|jgi:hypothetical protein|nr:hypothetical protein [Gaiellaceae bacterium]